MGRAICKVSVHRGGGTGNVKYLARSREEHLEKDREGHERQTETSLAKAREDDGLIWTYNTPHFVTGDAYGIRHDASARAELGKHLPSLPISIHSSASPAQMSKPMSLVDKRENAVAYFSMLSELEERKGGVTHLRIILTVGAEVSNRELKILVNTFLGENFSLAQAVAAIHENTKHKHAHLFVHARQLDNRRINLGQNYFQLDESWMRICAERLRDPEITDKHMALKAITLDWKEKAKEANSKGWPIPLKDDRWGDHHETLLRFRPWDDRWCGRLIAQTRVAEKRVEYLQVNEATEATQKEIIVATREAETLRERLERAEKRRSSGARSETKRIIPLEIITVSEALALKQYERAIQQRSWTLGQEEVTSGESLQLLLQEHVRQLITQGQVELNLQHVTESGTVPEHNLGSAEQILNISAEQQNLNQGTQGNPSTQPADHVHGKDSGSNLTASDRTDYVETLTGDELWLLIVKLELAGARAIALRAEEREFAQKPHLWLSPTKNISLSQLERQINTGLKQKRSIDNLALTKELVQQEVAEERGSLRQRRVSAEEEVRRLSEGLQQQEAKCSARNITLPAGRFSTAEIRELTAYAESASDPHLLKRVYEIECEQAAGDLRLTGDKQVIIHLEEKYLGLALKAEVSFDQSQKSLKRAISDPEKIMLPAQDQRGRDIAISLEQVQPQKGVKGIFRKLTEGREQRQFREQLESTKERFISHLKSESDTKKAFSESACAVVNECRVRSRELGFYWQAAPALERHEIQEIRDYTVKQQSGPRTRWLTACTQAQQLCDDREAAPLSSRKIILGADSECSEIARREVIQKDIESQRDRQQRMQRAPPRLSNPETPERSSRQRSGPNRGGGSRGR